MSIVGPRPKAVLVKKLRRKSVLFAPHAVKPGITGWAQILYPYGATRKMPKKLKYDLYYIKHMSPSWISDHLGNSKNSPPGPRLSMIGTSVSKSVLAL